MSDYFLECTTEWNSEEVIRDIEKMAGAGVAAGTAFLAARMRQVLGKDAYPKRRVRSRTGWSYLIAESSAIQGAPPRRVSGSLQEAVDWSALPDGSSSIWINKEANEDAPLGARPDIYGMVHERGNHPWMMRTINESSEQYMKIIAATARF